MKMHLLSLFIAATAPSSNRQADHLRYVTLRTVLNRPLIGYWNVAVTQNMRDGDRTRDFAALTTRITL